MGPRNHSGFQRWPGTVSEREYFWDRRRGDRAIEARVRFELGDILYTPRMPHDHCGIYVGCIDGVHKVVHHAGKTNGLVDKGPVEVTSLRRFAAGHGWRIRPLRAAVSQRHRAVAWALRAAKENRRCYNVFFSNCEHLVTEAYGSRQSSQVDAATTGAGVLGAVGTWVAGTAGRTLILGIIGLPVSMPILLGGLAIGAVIGSLFGIAGAKVLSLAEVFVAAQD